MLHCVPCGAWRMRMRSQQAGRRATRQCRSGKSMVKMQDKSKRDQTSRIASCRPLTKDNKVNFRSPCRKSRLFHVAQQRRRGPVGHTCPAAGGEVRRLSQNFYTLLGWEVVLAYTGPEASKQQAAGCCDIFFGQSSVLVHRPFTTNSSDLSRKA